MVLGKYGVALGPKVSGFNQVAIMLHRFELVFVGPLLPSEQTLARLFKLVILGFFGLLKLPHGSFGRNYASCDKFKFGSFESVTVVKTMLPLLIGFFHGTQPA